MAKLKNSMLYLKTYNMLHATVPTKYICRKWNLQFLTCGKISQNTNIYE